MDRSSLGPLTLWQSVLGSRDRASGRQPGDHGHDHGGHLGRLCPRQRGHGQPGRGGARAPGGSDVPMLFLLLLVSVAGLIALSRVQIRDRQGS